MHEPNADTLNDMFLCLQFSLSCPSNCSGKGICDIDTDGKQSCICDDPYDESPGCYGESLQKVDI